MTVKHAQAIWELCREGLHRCAEEAEAHWIRGEPYNPDEESQIPKPVAELIRRCNRQLRGEARHALAG